MALNLVVKVHPVVLFQIVDAFERRNADALRVIGTLLGKHAGKHKNCIYLKINTSFNEINFMGWIVEQ